jgi:hypothetical protein
MRPESIRIDPEVMSDAVKDPAMELSMDAAWDTAEKYSHDFIEKILVDELNKHAVQPEGGTWNKDHVWDIIESHNDQFVQLQHDAKEKIEQALSGFAEEMAMLVAYLAHES